jgi:hypothetical protein
MDMKANAVAETAKYNERVSKYIGRTELHLYLTFLSILVASEILTDHEIFTDEERRSV